MVVTMILITALMAGAATLTSMQTKAAQSAGLSRTGISALYCGESGLAAARAMVAASYPQWGAALGQPEPSWLAGVPHDIDGDNVADFTITLRDNEDETPNDPTHDNDLTVFVVSTCVKYPDQPAEVAELVRFNGGGNCYEAQLGGCGGNNNAN